VPTISTPPHSVKTGQCEQGRTKHKPAWQTDEDLRLLRLLYSRRHRLEGEMVLGWDRERSLELDLLIALEECVLNGAVKRLGLGIPPEGGPH
jgi:hypothetical protein